MLEVAGRSAPETLREDQLARRERIVRTALRALAGGEYDQVKIFNVARDSGVALGTLYRYFTSKEHLFATVFVEWQGAMNKKLKREPPSGATEADRLRSVLHRTIRAFQLQPQFFRVLMMMNTTTDPSAADLYQSISAQFYDSLQTAFDGPFDADREAICDTVNAVLYKSLRAWAMNRVPIREVYASVDSALWLIYEYCP